jgi:xylulokinase
MFLGVDIGTSGVKAAAVSEAGAVVAQASSPLSVAHPSPLWSEQDPDSWWEATDKAVSALPAEIRRSIRGIGLAGQMHGATVLGADDRPLRQAILWNDGRSFAECVELEATEPRTRAITGNMAMPGFTAPKLMWMRRHEPKAFAAIRTILLPKDYVRLRMAGDKASDLSDSAGTLWLDVVGRCWSETMLSASHLTRDQMPALHEGNEITGLLRQDIAAAWGMERVPVAAGGGDNAAGAAGVGVIEDGDALLSLGTSGVIFVASDVFRANTQGAVHAFCHCLPGAWHQMAVHLSAAACIDWAARIIGVGGPAQLLALAEATDPANGPELFLPYLSGERTPHNDPHVRGAFLRLGADTGPGQIASAVLEGVAFALADGLAALRDAGTEIETLSVIGGGARSHHWGRILASVLGVPLVYRDGGEVGPALGAARLAQLAVDQGPARAICTKPPIVHVIEPDTELSPRLSAKLDRFRAAYPLVSKLQE